MPRKPIVGGNWKCNPAETAKLPELVETMNKVRAAAQFGRTARRPRLPRPAPPPPPPQCDTTKCDVYVCPSPLHVGIVYKSFTSGVKVAPQNCNFKGCGAYTGEMAADQMKDMGIEWCLIGHSERRGEFGLPTPAESSELLATKLAYLLEKGIKVILAIGEPLPIREKGIDAVLAECVNQLNDIKGMLDPSRVVIAYEPVWAIGTGVTASPEQAQETHAAIRKWIAKECGQAVADAIRIQYGGSANAKNAPDLSAQPDIDGFLVGGASLKPEFADIVKAISAA